MIIKDVIVRFMKERFFDQAAQTAYYLLLSMLPFLIFVLSLLSIFPINDEILLDFLEPFIPIESFKLVENSVQEIVGRNNGNLIVTSLVLAFWISSIAVQSLGRSLDLAYGHVRSLPFWKVIIRDLGITLLFMIVIPLSLFLPFIVRLLRKLVAYSDTIEDLHVWLYIWPNLKWALGTLFLFSFFLLFYK
ncbi:YihY/virulence factor BrkB family protein, partial [Microvirga sp. 3-52]|nr:YihY/virulence factor BrkB family protein [Microvirga sp. 3-52]